MLISDVLFRMIHHESDLQTVNIQDVYLNTPIQEQVEDTDSLPELLWGIQAKDSDFSSAELSSSNNESNSLIIPDHSSSDSIDDPMINTS